MLCFMSRKKNCIYVIKLQSREIEVWHVGSFCTTTAQVNKPVNNCLNAIIITHDIYRAPIVSAHGHEPCHDVFDNEVDLMMI